MAVHIPRPKDWQEFQRGCVVLFASVLNDPSLSEYGRLGEAQDGIDILGRYLSDASRYVAIQCRHISRPMTMSKILRDCRLAVKLRYPLEEMIFATTLPRSVAFHADAHSAEQTLAEEKTPLRVKILGWEDLEDMINRYPAVLDYFLGLAKSHPSGAPEVTHAVTALGATAEVLLSALELVKENAEKNGIPLTTIQAIFQREGSIPDNPTAAIAAISRVVDEVDKLRRSQAASSYGANPKVMAAATAALREGDLDSYATLLSDALVLQDTDREKLAKQQYDLAQQLSVAQTVQGKFDDAVRTMEDAISLFNGRKDKPVEPFIGRWRLAGILAEKGRRLADPNAMREAIQSYEALESDLYVQTLPYLKGRIIVNCFKIKKWLLLLDFKYDDIPAVVPELRAAMDHALKGFNEDVDQTRTTIWESIFEAGDHADDAELLLASLNVASLMHSQAARPVRKSRNERSRANTESFNRFVETASKVILNLYALYRIDQVRFEQQGRNALVLAESSMKKIVAFGLQKLRLDVVVMFSRVFSSCTKISMDASFARRARALLNEYAPETRDTEYLRGLPDLEAAKAHLALEHWWVLSSFHHPGEIAKLEADYRAASYPPDQYRIAELLQYCGDAYHQAALLLRRPCMPDALRCYRHSLTLLAPIVAASPAYSSRLSARVWSKSAVVSATIGLDIPLN